MRKLVCVLIALTLALSSLAAFAAEDKLTITVATDNADVAVGDQFMVSFVVSGEGEINTFELIGSFDATVAEALSAVFPKGGMSIIQNDIDNEKGFFHIVGYMLGSEEADGYYLCSLVFEAKKEGLFVLSLGEVEGVLGILRIGSPEALNDSKDAADALFYTVESDDFSIEIAGSADRDNIVIFDESKQGDPKEDKEEAIEYTDLDKHAWASGAVYALAQSGILDDIAPAPEYKPALDASRADIMLMLVRAAKLTAEDASESFPDVEGDAYYADAIKIAKALGIAKGSTDGKYYPETGITRQDLCTLIYRTLVSIGTIDDSSVDAALLDKFSDKEAVSDYAVNAMSTMVDCEIIRGNADGTLNPRGNTTRAEAAVIIDRVISLMYNLDKSAIAGRWYIENRAETIAFELKDGKVLVNLDENYDESAWTPLAEYTVDRSGASPLIIIMFENTVYGEFTVTRIDDDHAAALDDEGRIVTIARLK